MVKIGVGRVILCALRVSRLIISLFNQIRQSPNYGIDAYLLILISTVAILELGRGMKQVFAK